MTPENVARMSAEDQAEWSLELSGDLTPDKLAKMTPAQKAKIRIDTHSGTGFIVFYSDERAGKDQGFQYLVTNRHISQPGVEVGKTCKVLQYSVALNHKGSTADDPDHIQVSPIAATEAWYYSTDSSVDLAVIPVSIPPAEWDFQMIQTTMFADKGMIERHEIVEGDQVFFAGLFVQYAGGKKLQPVVRSGSIAMLPDDLIPTTLKSPGHIYFAEAHSFGGNSGSPMFVDLNKFKSFASGYDYRLLGVVTGEVTESNDFSLQVSTSYSGTVVANSDISIIVPASEVKAILDSPQLQKIRDEDIAKLPAPKK